MVITTDVQLLLNYDIHASNSDQHNASQHDVNMILHLIYNDTKTVVNWLLQLMFKKAMQTDVNMICTHV